MSCGKNSIRSRRRMMSSCVKIATRNWGEKYSIKMRSNWDRNLLFWIWGTRRRRTAAIMFFVALVVVAWNIGLTKRWAAINALIYFAFTIGANYSWMTTKICPLQIMAGNEVGSWPRAFRLMYKKR